jgi:hypothetical protein
MGQWINPARSPASHAGGSGFKSPLVQWYLINNLTLLSKYKL